MQERKEILTGLNKRQKEAVETTEGPLLIMAGAGSGKTRVLTHRIAYLIHEKQVNPWNILAITFTNKAADEMKIRVGDLVKEGGGDVWVSTFHSMCVRILRREIDQIGYSRSFTIAASSEQKTLIKRVLKKLNLDSKKFSPNAILSDISNAKNQLITDREYQKRAQGYWQRTVAQCYTEYQAELRKAETLDFDDLIMLTVRLFEEKKEILSYYQRKFQYIHVDEYQDTNHAQYQLVELLAQRFNNICVVGDADQSIYGWRGADMSNILDFEKDYPEAKTIFLEQNYRSTKNILQAANTVIENNPNRKEKNLWTDNPSGDKITVYFSENEYAETEYVADQIKSIMNADLSLDYDDFAILYRTNAMSRVMEETLIKRNIPFQIIGGTGYYARKEILDLMAYLTLIVNPADDLSFRRVVNEPKRGIGAATVSKLSAIAEMNDVSLYEAALTVQDTNLSARAANNLEGFALMIQDFRRMTEYLTVTDLVEAILDQTGYLDRLKKDNSLESDARIENLEEFYSITQNFDKVAEEDATLLEFLTDLSLLAPTDEMEEETKDVTLMTLHSAKGLEYPYVFIIGVEDTIFPLIRQDSDEEDLEEERRLAYVGITRAEKKLFLTNASSRMLYGRRLYNRTSPFIRELADEVVEVQRPEEIPSYKTGDYSNPFKKKQKISGVKEFKATPTSRRRKKVKNAGVGAENISWQAGDKVKHKKWGTGTVIQTKGQGQDLQLDIAFPSEGIKPLLASFAPIEKVEDE
ncbi:MAG: DNA helicase PcrA [Atopostipes suicloacalis]|nr:DNA helicase PcrA [Atopostipes suicloacalis]MDN6730571.1 DNA helicase PcrA [Atopostipes suicloacalis]